MLCLKNETNPDWINVAKQNINEIMIDHAHCEKKAAFTGMSFINKYPAKMDLTLAMSDLVEEEIGHYRSVVEMLKKKNVDMTHDKGDDYVKQLFTQIRKGEEKFLDHLLIAGIIEARSCERLQILAENIEDQELASFYNELAATEAGHYMAFIKLAKNYFQEEVVKNRLDELTDFEAKLISNAKNLPLMHG